MTHRHSHPALSIFLLVAFSVGTAHAKAPKDVNEEIFYSLGVMFAQTLGEFALTEKELELVMQGVREAVAGEAGPLDMQTLQPRLAALHQARAARNRDHLLLDDDRQPPEGELAPGRVGTGLREGRAADGVLIEELPAALRREGMNS